MIKSFKKSRVNGCVFAPSSKSESHRALIMAALSRKKTAILNLSDCTDVMCTVKALESIGADIKTDGNKTTVWLKTVKKEAYFDCGESASTLRFIVPLCAALGIKATVKMCKRLAVRPHDGLCAPFKIAFANPLIVDTKFPQTAVISAEKTSQVLSGALMCLPVTKSKIKIVGDIHSKPYVDLTEKMMAENGVTLKSENGEITANGEYNGATIKINGDYSSAAPILAFGALGGKAEIENLNPDTAQGDKAILDILIKFGADVYKEGGKLSVTKAEFKPLCLSVSDIPDLFPTVAVLCSASKGESKISGVSRLNFKESDRLSAVMLALDNLGVKSELKNDVLHIYGGTFHEGTVDAKGDHRLCEAFSLFSALTDVTVQNFTGLEKSYKNYLNDIKSLGVTASEVEI